jgi:Rad9
MFHSKLAKTRYENKDHRRSPALTAAVHLDDAQHHQVSLRELQVWAGQVFLTVLFPRNGRVPRQVLLHALHQSEWYRRNCLHKPTLTHQSLISIFRSRTGTDTQRDIERHTIIDKCDVAIEDGEGISSRFIARIVFRNGLTSTHRLPFEVTVPVHAKFNASDSPHHWVIASRTLRQLMDHFGPGIDLLDINTDGDHVNFTCYSEKSVSEDGKQLQTNCRAGLTK